MANEIGYMAASPTDEDQNDLTGLNTGLSHANAAYHYTANSGDTVTQVSARCRRSFANAGTAVVFLRNVSTDAITHATTITPGDTTQHGLRTATVSWALSAGVTYSIGIIPTAVDVYISHDTGGAGQKSLGAQSTVSATWDNSTGGYKDTAIAVVSADVTAGGGSPPVLAAGQYDNRLSNFTHLRM